MNFRRSSASRFFIKTLPNNRNAAATVSYVVTGAAIVSAGTMVASYYDSPLLSSSFLFQSSSSECEAVVAVKQQQQQQNRSQSSGFKLMASSSLSKKPTTTTTTTTTQYHPNPKLIFLGTGSSTGCPKPLCTMEIGGLQEQEKLQQKLTSEQFQFRQQLESRCKVSNIAIRDNPKQNKNYRNNPSFLIQHYYYSSNNENGNENDKKDDSTTDRIVKNIIIDVGKTFREGALRWFPQYNINSLDAIILTHHHMDAAAGLDDVRGFQRIKDFSKVLQQQKQLKRIPISIYLSRFCYDDLSERFPWLLPRKDISIKGYNDNNNNNNLPIVKRDVASFDVNIINDFIPFTVAKGLDIIPLPIWHGDDLISLGFAFSVPHSCSSTTSGTKSTTKKTTNVVYLSDISRMIPETLEFIQTQLPPTDILIVDALLWKKPHPVHFSLLQAIELRDKIQPRQMTYLVGMNCDSFLPHDEMNNYLEKTYGKVQLAHDGLAIELES